jgi:hypothetical protein
MAPITMTRFTLPWGTTSISVDELVIVEDGVFLDGVMNEKSQ